MAVWVLVWGVGAGVGVGVDVDADVGVGVCGEVRMDARVKVGVYVGEMFSKRERVRMICSHQYFHICCCGCLLTK